MTWRKRSVRGEKLVFVLEHERDKQMIADM
jgi:hypothetical protein